MTPSVSVFVKEKKMCRIISIGCVAMAFCITIFEPVWGQGSQHPLRPINITDIPSDRFRFDFPGKAYIPFDEKKYTLRSNLNFSKKNISDVDIQLHLELLAFGNPPLRNVDFSGSTLTRVSIPDFEWVNCDFSETKLSNVAFGRVPGSNFQNAWLEHSAVNLSREQLLSTASYKAKRLVGLRLNEDYSGVCFAGFDLRYSNFWNSNLTDSDFKGAAIEGVVFSPLSWRSAPALRIEQLLATRDFKKGVVKGISFIAIFPEHVVDFSNMVFIECAFGGIGKIDLTNSIISSCDFRLLQGLTLDNIKSTWNYKHGRMEGILLPPDIQAALDAEKRKP
jgi:uncharacterized protein YjbI with pentapeptide repeats